ncbi:MAG TPA: tetratricopeptide repeat protein [Pirellulaceae bacterium]
MLLSDAGAQDKGAVSSSAAVLAYREAANFQNNGALEVAVEEWQKFLKNFPGDPLAAKAQHYLGVCQLQLKSFAAAAEAFEAVVAKHPKFELLEETLFDLGTCQYAMARGGEAARYEAAAKAFGTLLDKYPASKHADEALFYRGEAFYAAGQKAEAIKAYVRLDTQFANSKWRAEALYALGVAEEELGDSRGAAEQYQAFLKEFGQQPRATDVKLRLAESLLKAGDAERAAKLFGELAANPLNQGGDWALVRLGYCLVKLDRAADAAAVFSSVPEKLPDSKYVAEATLLAGRLFYRADKLDEASKWLIRAMQLPGHEAAEAAHWLCRILLKRGEAKKAAEIGKEEAVRHGDAPFAVNLRLDQADALYEMPERREEALALYAKLVDDHPQHELAAQALYGAAFTALKLMRYEEALQYAERFLKAYAASDFRADVEYVAAECNLQLRNYDAAGAQYRKLLSESPKHADADAWRLRVGLISYLKKDYQGAITDLSPVAAGLKSAEARAEALFLVGASQFHENRFAEAKQSLRESVAASAKWRQADETLLLLARTEAKAGDTTLAIDHARRFLAEYPMSKLLDEIHYRLGEWNAAAGDSEGAVREYGIVAAKFADSSFAPYALEGKAWAEYKQKDFAAGRATFSQLIETFPQHALVGDARYGRALCCRQLGDFAAAVADLDVVLRSSPEAERRADALFERGLAQVAAKDSAAAAASFEELLKANPRYASADQALYEIGWAIKSQDKQVEAAKAFERLAKDYPESPLAAEAWFHVGEDCYERKDLGEAATAYSKARAAKASGELAEKATYKLAWTEYEAVQYSAAERHFAEQLKAFPRGALAADAAFMRAECLFRLEKYEAAEALYEVALKTKPESPTARAMLLLHAGQTAAQLKKWETSAAILTQLLETQPESPLLAEANYELGWAKQNLKQLDDAQHYYEAATEQSKGTVGARARFMRGELFFAAKKYDEASKEFQRAMYGYGGEQAANETKNWQAKSGYEAGRCAEVQIGTAADAATKKKLVADAERCYRFVLERHAGHELAEIARKRLAALGKL